MIEPQISREKRNARRRVRYRNDPEYRERLRANQLRNGRKYEEKNKEKRLARRRKLYAEDGGRAREYASAWRRKNIDKALAASRARRVSKPWQRLLSDAKRRSIKRGLDFTLTRAWAESRYTGFCEITGVPFDISPGRIGPSVTSPSIDRIDNGLGYIGDNCRFILFCVNAFRGGMADSEMVAISRAIVDKLDQGSENCHAE